MNKKAQLSESIKTGGGVTLGIVGLLLVLYIANTLFGGFLFGNDVNKETKQSLEGFETALNELDGNGDFIFKFSKKYSMVVFENDKGSYGSGSDGYYIRPSYCFDKACIVICDDKDDRKACLKSKYYIKSDINGFLTISSKGLVYPETIGNSKDEHKKIVFNKIEDKININVVNAN